MYPPPTVVTAEVFARLPDGLRRPHRTAWADANRAGEPVDSFLEGPSFDRAGDLYVTDIPHGRVLRVDPAGAWSVVAEYDGWPNGLVFHRDGRAFVADHRRGVLELDPVSGTVSTVVDTVHSEGLKGVNDLTFGSDGALYVTDQGQTGLQDPTGRVLRWSGGRTEKLIDTVPSPNGLVLDREERQLYVAVTRANAVWRLPLMPDGTVSKAGLWIQLSGGLAGPDGMALDEEGGVVVAHVGTGVWRFDRLGRPTHMIECPGEGPICTNVAFGGPGNRSLFVTDSGTGTVLRAELPVRGQPLFSGAGAGDGS